MRIFGFEIINIKRHIHKAYTNGGNEAAYAAYRAITGATVQQSWRKVKPWIKVWEVRRSIF